MKTWDKRPELQVARYPENLLKSAAKEVVFILRRIDCKNSYFVVY